MEQAADADDLRASEALASSSLSSEITSVPERIGDFQVVREIGRGGMGIVYAVFEQSLSRRVALKLIPEQATLSPHSRERFEREARAAARLHHSGIVPVFARGQHDGRLDHLAFDRTGRFLLAIGPGHMNVWDWHDKRSVEWLDTASPATCAVLSPDGLWLAIPVR